MMGRRRVRMGMGRGMGEAREGGRRRGMLVRILIQIQHWGCC
jgi:hypothetical protein